MGYLIMMGSCAACHSLIQFNPNKVPSIRINGKREPLCLNCANRWNELHPENARPIDKTAYEWVDESEV